MGLCGLDLRRCCKNRAVAHESRSEQRKYMKSKNRLLYPGNQKIQGIIACFICLIYLK